MRCKNREHHWPIEEHSLGETQRDKCLNFVIGAVGGFSSGLLPPLKYTIKDNHLKSYTLSTCLQFKGERKRKCNFLNGFIWDWALKYCLVPETATMSVINSPPLRNGSAGWPGGGCGHLVTRRSGNRFDTPDYASLRKRPLPSHPL